MLSIDPAHMNDRETYKFLIGSVIPRPIAFVTTLSQTGVLNAAPFSFFNVVSAHPPLVSVSVQRVHGQPKDTAKHAMFRQAFVVHICDETNVDAVNQTAATLPEDESEVVAAKLTPIASKVIDVPGIQEAKIRMECRLERAIPFGVDSEITCDLLIGRVVQFHIDERLYENGHIDATALQPVSRLAGNDYATLGKIFTRERPR